MKKKVRKHYSQLDLLEEKVNVQQLLNSVYLDEDRLIEASLEQPKLQFSAGRYRVQCMHKRVMLETKLDLARAQVALKYRRIRDVGGKKEYTEGAIREKVELNTKVHALRKKLDTAVCMEELAKNLIEVFRSRSDSIRSVVQAGKVSLHARELELLTNNRKLRRAVIGLRQTWANRGNLIEGN